MNRYCLPVPKKLKDIRPAPFHKTHERMRYCIDFALPVGTPVKSISNGRVIEKESRFQKTYSDPQYADRANYIEIRHQDGRSSLYAHLQWGSIKIKVGQKIKKGQIIGLSGQTGYATYPHLHFGLYDKDGSNIPVQFAD